MPSAPQRINPLLAGLALALPVAAGAGALLAIGLRRLGAAMALQRGIFQYAVDGILLLDEHGTIMSFNPAAEQIFGYAAAEVEGSNIRRLVPEPYHVAFRLISLGAEVLGRRKDGSTFPMELTSGRVLQAGRVMYIGVARDVTRRVRTAEDLAHARDQAEAASRAKSAFLLTMSHELRTPLNHILGYSEILYEEAEERGQHALLPDLQKIQGAGRHLLGLIDTVLALAALEAGDVALSPRFFDAAALLRDLARDLAPLADRGANTLQVDAPAACPIYADEARVRQVLAQLVDNACKFTERGAITLALTADEQPAPTVTFRVSDTGIGIPPAQLERLFEPFGQGDGTTTRRHGGAGLGLALARRLCERMGGVISVTSEPGQGSNFCVRLPAG